MTDTPKVFQFNRADYNASLPRIQQHHAYFTGNVMRMGGDNTAIEYDNDQQIINLFFMMQINKIQPEIILPPPPRSRTNKIYDYTLAVILLTGGIWGAIYLLWPMVFDVIIF